MLLGRANLTLGEVQVSHTSWQQCHCYPQHPLGIIYFSYGARNG